MKSVIGFASVLVNFSSTVKSIPLASYSQCPTLKTWKWNLVMKRESWLLREILHGCKRCEDLWDIQLNGKYIIVTVLIINNKFWKCYLYPFACSLFLALFTSFFMILFFFFLRPSESYIHGHTWKQPCRFWFICMSIVQTNIGKNSFVSLEDAQMLHFFPQIPLSEAVALSKFEN